MNRQGTLLIAGAMAASVAFAPVAQAKPSESPSSRAEPAIHTVHVDPDQLPTGPLPKVPYYQEGTKVLHDGDREIKVKLPRDDAHGASGHHATYPVRGGYIVQTRAYSAHPRLFYVRKNGERARIGGFVNGFEDLNVVVGADRARIAYIRWRGGIGDQVVEVRRVSDGQLVARRALGQGSSYSLSLLGMRDGKLWFADGYGTRVRTWHLGKRKVTTYDAPPRGRGGLRADLSARRVVVDRGFKRCVSVLSIPKRPAKRWLSCGGVVPKVWSPDDRYVVGFDDHDTAVVRRSVSGKPVVRFTGITDGGPLPDVVWESNDTFIADAYVETDDPTNPDVALVRCNVSGECEVAARWSSLDDDEQLSVATRTPS
ncbi:hypothetical protein MU582_00780 [Nocardioidaceae bacterium SCSIO 66511]|nr:hypothetical protein MU582_00780 [Nocardioidaceae bacterium SCSIO 66511]